MAECIGCMAGVFYGTFINQYILHLPLQSLTRILIDLGLLIFSGYYLIGIAL